MAENASTNDALIVITQFEGSDRLATETEKIVR